MTSPNTPNIFTHATSELSQDAFIAYLLEWANPATYTSEEGVAMHQAGRSFLQLLLKEHGVNTEELTNIDVKTQKSNIDVLAKLTFTGGQTKVLIIEDKVHAGSYNDLNSYVKAAKKIYPEAEENIYGVYLRTGNQADYGAIKVKKFKVITRKDLLSYLEVNSNAVSLNTVFRDFNRHLLMYQERINAFKLKPVEEWSHEAWIGFYRQVLCPDERLHFGLYDYVPNKQGGFHGCWWPDNKRLSFQGQPAYLQIEKDGLLTFKLGPVALEAQSSQLGKDFFYAIHKAALEQGKLKGQIVGNTIRKRNKNRLIKRSLSIKGANFMTIAFVPREDWFPSGTQPAKAAENLLMYQNFLEAIIPQS